MDLESLEESLSDILPVGFHLGKDKRGQIIIFTNLKHDEDDFEGDLVSFEDEEDDDPDFDSEDTEELLEEDEDDEE